jgi:hypothetical protein
MAVAFIEVRAGARMPAKVVSGCRPFVPPDTCRAIDERILIDLCIATVEDHHTMITIPENVSRSDDTL